MTNTPHKFWDRKVSVRAAEQCWPHTLKGDKDGYGRVRIGGAPARRAHHIAWELTNGPIAPGLWVLHKCDYPPCCNPSHLFLGTALDNYNDMVSKGRDRGRQNLLTTEEIKALRREQPGHRFGGYSKLTKADVSAIRSLRSAGRKSIDLAREFGVARVTINHIVARRRWADVA